MQSYITGSRSKGSVIMPGAIALPVAGTFVALCLDQLIGFMVKQCVECFLNAVSNEIFKMVLYKSFIQLYNVIRHNSLPPWDIGYGDLIVPRAKTYVYLIEFAKLIIRHLRKTWKLKIQIWEQALLVRRILCEYSRIK